MNVTIASVVKDEEDFLPRALECWMELGDRVRILDNGSSDSTIDILKDAADRHPDFRWGTCTTPMDGNEWVVRKSLFDYASEGADWLVHCDADQIFAGDFRPHLKGNAALFYVYDLWSPTEYRSDAHWQARPWWKAIRVGQYPDRVWQWRQRGWHSGHLPANTRDIGPISYIPEECGILHYGYATPERRTSHYEAYMNRMEHLVGDGERYQAISINDEDPRVVDLPFEPRWTLL